MNKKLILEAYCTLSKYSEILTSEEKNTLCKLMDNNKYNFVEQYKFTDICPDYKTKESYQMFIQSRKEDIKNIKIAIKEAKRKLKLF